MTSVEVNQYAVLACTEFMSNCRVIDDPGRKSERPRPVVGRLKASPIVVASKYDIETVIIFFECWAGVAVLKIKKDPDRPIRISAIEDWGWWVLSNYEIAVNIS